ncbi:MAG: succinate CoA transferase [Planctomycetaceae bacterium]|nr:succinate CoA transferase [Planctomycetaceae bacterium]
MATISGFAKLSACEAADFIPDGALVGFSGFTPAGAAKAVPRALAARAQALHDRGERFRIRVLTGASTGPALDDALAEANAISWRAPYQSSAALRKRINRQEIEFVDMHLSHLPQMVECGFFGNLDLAVVEGVDLTPEGRLTLSTSVGASPTFLRHADRVIVELNRRHSPRLGELHDIWTLPLPPERRSIPIERATSRIGTSYIAVDPAKIVGVVVTNEADGVAAFDAPNAMSEQIADHVISFLLEETRRGRLPAEWLPLQSGVGNIGNAVMARLGAHPDVPPLEMYSEVFQDALVDLMETGRLRGASATSLTLSDAKLQRVYDNIDFFAPRIVLRPQELSNNPGVIRRLGVIAINTVLEMDLAGCANSTHVCGGQLMNGIGGSGDFTRNAYLSFLVAPSTAKGGRISTVVPMASHVDHNEHSVQVVVTEQGLADLRGLGPMERARRIIENCAHPAYREYLHSYLEGSPAGHIRHDLGRCFELHRNLLETGRMLPI